MEFDFDAWSKLAKEDPDEFERRRRAAVRAAVESAPTTHRQRLEGLQFRLDLERNRAGTALASRVRMNSLMWAGFHRLRRELNKAAQGAPETVERAKPGTSAEIIPMQRYREARRSCSEGREKR